MEHYEALQNITERCMMLQDATEALRIITDHYGALTECYGTVTENIDFGHH